MAGQDGLVERYLEALCLELANFQPGLGHRVDTVFVGGGTPSRLRAAQLDRLLGAVRRRFDLSADAEITVECNPESIDAAKLRGYRDAGVTRVSIGVQTLDDAVLARVNRSHDARRALDATAVARSMAGLEVNVDLIAGLPGERLEGWTDTVGEIARLGTDHVSLYLLESDKPTPLGRALREDRGEPAAIANDDDGDTLARVYEESVARLRAAGFELYEISNFAREGKVSRHNLKYWSDAWYGGFGLGAHAYFQGARRANRSGLQAYLEAVEQGRDPLAREDPWDAARRLEEALWLGLRVVRGIDLAKLGRRYGVDLHACLHEVWRRARRDGLIDMERDLVRLTPTGRLYSNELFSRIAGEFGS